MRILRASSLPGIIIRAEGSYPENGRIVRKTLVNAPGGRNSRIAASAVRISMHMRNLSFVM